MRTFRPRLVVLFGAAVLLCACSTAAPPALQSTPTDASPSLPVVLPACVRAEDGRAVQVSTSAGVSDGVLMGAGTRGVVIAHQINDGMCDYIDLARGLVEQGYHVALYSQLDAYRDLPAWTDELAADGATKIVLLGASIGAMAALSVGPDKAPPVTGIISLSALSGLDGGDGVDNAVSQLRLPVLFVAAEDDPDGAGPMARGFLKECPSKDKQLILVPGGAHGISTTLGPAGAPVRTAIGRFLQRHTR